MSPAPRRALAVWGATVLLVAVGAGAGAVGGGTATAATPASFSAYESSLYASINGARAQVGLPGLSAAPGLTDVARGWASAMSAAGALSHNPDLASEIEASGARGWTVAAENVGVGGPADGIFTAYMASPAHRDNILRSTVDSVGLGALRTSDGRVWDVMVFSNGYDPAYGASHTAPMPLAADGSMSPAPAPPPAPVPVGSPVGSLDSVSAGPGSIAVSGWAVDPGAATSPAAVHVYVDGVGKAVLSAADPRPDVAAAVPGAGAAHGYSATVAVAGGNHTVCAYAINVGPGANTTFGCRAVTVGGSPVGSLDGVSVIAGGSVTVRGWTLDPDTVAAIPVHVYVDGVLASISTADAPRGDLAGPFPGFGTAHSYRVTVPVGPGPHTVCTYGIDTVAPSAPSWLGCVSATA